MRESSNGNLSERDALELIGKTCKSSNIGLWEAFLYRERTLSIESRDQKVESLVRAVQTGTALRVLVDGRQGFSYATDLRADSLKTMVENARAGAKEISSDPLRDLSPPWPEDIPELEIFDPEAEDVSESDKISKALELEQGALSHNSLIQRVRSAVYEETYEDIYIVNSLGLNLYGRRSTFGVSLMAVAEKGSEAQMGFEFDFNYKYDKLRPRETGARAAAKAAGLLGAKQTATGSRAVVFAPEAGAELAGVLAGAFSAEAVAKGRSWLTDKPGDKVFSNIINIIDDGLFIKGDDAFPFDGEGTPCSRTLLVENGVLRGFIFDRYYGRKMGAQSTGNSLRNTITSPPKVGPTNIYIEPGEGTMDDLIRRAHSGILVQHIMGIHTADPVTGEFSLGIAGMIIENGRLAEPFCNMAMAGTLKEVFQRIEDISGDLRFAGGCGSPGILIGSVDISGS